MALLSRLKALPAKFPIPFYFCSLLIAAAATIPILRDVLREDALFKRDHIQDHLMAIAIVRGEDPYQPIPQMLERYCGAAEPAKNPHASPHPISASLLAVPFVPFGPYVSALALSCLGIILLYASFGILLRDRIPGWAPVAAMLSGVSMLLPSHQAELMFGTLNPVLLFLGTFMCTALLKNKEKEGGALLGALLSIRFFGWPYLLWLAATRRFQALLTALLVFSAAQLLTLALVGSEPLLRYYVEILGSVSALWRHNTMNHSVWTLWPKLLETVSWVPGAVAYIPPSGGPSWLTTLLSLGTFAALIGPVLFHAVHSRTPKRAVLALFIASIAAGPMLWGHYFVLLYLPVVLCFTVSPWWGGAAVGLLAVLDLWPRLIGMLISGIEGTALPKGIAFLSVIPSLVLFAWSYALVRNKK